MRNIRDRQVPLADLAEQIGYLTLNALEWAHLEGQERLRAAVPIITVTDGARGSRLLLGDRELCIPATRRDGPVNVNRAGETYGATVFSLLRQAHPDFHRCGVTPELAEWAVHRASEQAARQLDIASFGFPNPR
jgi:sugar/nucleoside kinase (ribokinase family)